MADADPPGQSAPTPAAPKHAHIYDELKRRLLTGKIAPGVGLSTRGLAAELGVSQMPVRDALSRLAAEGAVVVRSKRRVEAPPMDGARFADLLECRLLLEPRAAVLALPRLDGALVARLQAIDSALDRAIADDDPLGYMEANHAFHFTLYRANGREVLNRAIEGLWLGFGPHMRAVYGRLGTGGIVDRHAEALAAIGARDARALEAAVRADIAEGMGLVGRMG